VTEPANEEPTQPAEQDDTPQPWAPEGAGKVGVGPAYDREGERGTSAFSGNDQYNADGTPADPHNPERGPKSGVHYAAPEGSDLGTHASDGREEASRG
jgi:hypothetical protein